MIQRKYRRNCFPHASPAQVSEPFRVGQLGTVGSHLCPSLTSKRRMQRSDLVLPRLSAALQPPDRIRAILKSVKASFLKLL